MLIRAQPMGDCVPIPFVPCPGDTGGPPPAPLPVDPGAGGWNPSQTFQNAPKPSPIFPRFNAGGIRLVPFVGGVGGGQPTSSTPGPTGAGPTGQPGTGPAGTLIPWWGWALIVAGVGYLAVKGGG